MRLLILAVLVLCAPVFGQAWPGSVSDWNGFERHDFELDGRACILVEPAIPAEGRPWIWRARFFGHEPQADLALLARGFHLAYMDVAGLFGAPRALDRWDAFYDWATRERSLARRTVLEGMSRGGLPIYHWALRHPERVACIYADNPVLDFTSWPGGLGAGQGSAAEWSACLAAWSLDESHARSFEGHPFQGLEPLARAGVPLLHIVGTADEVVPVAENTTLLFERYRALGGPITLIEKEGLGHHPHSLEDPAPIVDFVLRHTLQRDDFLELRGGLDRARQAFEAGGAVRVAFLGGSITHNAGWRELVMADLSQRFPRADFTFVNAGIPSMGSTPGAFRFARDVLSHGNVDLLFVEAAVNDSTNGRSGVEQLRGMEGILRHARRAQPRMDVVVMHFVDPDKMDDWRAGRMPEVVAVHERVAAHYGAPSLDLSREVTARIDAGEFTWEGDFRGLHPSPFGQTLYARSIQRLLNTAWSGPLPAHPAPHDLPPPLDPHSYAHATLVPPDRAATDGGFRRVESWRPEAGQGATRAGFVDVPMYIGEQVGAHARFAFEGRAVGLFVAAGPDAGMIEWRVDGGDWSRLDLFTRWSAGLHLPWAHVLAADLKPGAHELEWRILSERNPASTGHAVRIAHFLVNY